MPPHQSLFGLFPLARALLCAVVSPKPNSQHLVRPERQHPSSLLTKIR